jgi:putative ABC transport system ATP-binding protein
LIELRHVEKVYTSAAGQFRALKDINVQIDRGEFVAIVGKSGSGKSTLINMVTGVDRPSSGEVFVGDTAVHTLSEDEMARWRGQTIGVVYQFFQLMPSLTVVENVMLPMDFCHTYPAHTFYRRSMEILEQVDLVEHAHKFPAAISGGQQQRVAIARALINDPAIIMADEPTGNLDSRTADAVFQLFEHLVAQGKTLLLVTHDPDLARRAYRTITIADGAIVADATCNRDNPQPAAAAGSNGAAAVAGHAATRMEANHAD